MPMKLRKTTYNPNVTYNPGETKIKYKMDKNFLNMIICYIFTKSRVITKANLMAIRKFFDCVDTNIYSTNVELYARVIFIEKALECILSKGIERKEIIIDYCRMENDKETEEIIENIDKFGALSLTEIKMVNKTIADRLKYAYIVFYKERLNDLFMRMDQGQFKSLNEINTIMKGAMSACLNDIRKSENNAASNAFCLMDDIMTPYISELIKKVTDPSLTFKTGIQYLNDMLSPGFAPGRLYLFLGLTGGYKSSMLLQCARWIKLYNKTTPRRKEPTAVPTVLVITTENTVEESVIRIFNMSSDDKPINEYTAQEAISILKNEGHLNMKDGSTDIYIAYYANNELDTSDLYAIIEDLEDDNREVIALILDYIKRIRPAEPSSDERIQLKNVSNELKSLAVKLDIPVITAQQINRAGNAAIDAAAGEGKEDLARYIGRQNVALSWDLLENVDWAAIINIEKEKRSGLLYLTIKRIKIRYKDNAKYSYINHPFAPNSTIRLLDDINLDKPISKESLSSDMEGVSLNHSKGTVNAQKREVRSSTEEFKDVFDFSKSLS
jgi:replicative DNA helicase